LVANAPVPGTRSFYAPQSQALPASPAPALFTRRRRGLWPLPRHPRHWWCPYI